MRNGGDYRLPKLLDQTTGMMVGGHKMQAVYGEMMCQIALDYAGCPDVRTMTLHQIRYFYDRLRPSIKRRTTQK